MGAELILQAECTLWFNQNMKKHRGKFRRVRNETDLKGKHGIIQGMQNKASGIVSGTWDAFLIHKPIVWIEFKVGKGTLSTEQKEFGLMGMECDWIFRTVYNLEQFKKVCYEFYGLQ